MDLNYFKNLRILDGGMGQELLRKGLKSKGTLWSTSALLDENFHKLVVDVHLSFINAGADVIVTNNFSSRRMRLIENKVEDKFDYVNKKYQLNLNVHLKIPMPSKQMLVELKRKMILFYLLNFFWSKT